jgi:hypothetical protein
MARAPKPRKISSKALTFAETPLAPDEEGLRAVRRFGQTVGPQQVHLRKPGQDAFWQQGRSDSSIYLF